MIEYAFRPVQDELKNHADEEGKWLIQDLIDLNEPFDTALNAGDKKRTIEIVQMSIPILKELVPHLNEKQHRDLFGNLADAMEAKLQDGNSVDFADLVRFGLKNFRHINQFFKLPPRSKKNFDAKNDKIK